VAEADKTKRYSVENTGYTFVPIKQMDPYVSSTAHELPDEAAVNAPESGSINAGSCVKRQPGVFISAFPSSNG
jgi:hypothetical protein